jgi:surface protein
MGNAIGIGVPMVSIALGGGGSSAPFIFDAITTADAEVFQMPFRTTSTVNAEVDWGDGTSDTVTSSAEAVHTYATAGTHTITVTGTINGWSYYFANQDGVSVDKDQMGNVSQWGSFLVDEDVTFYQCTNMTVSATDRLKFTDTYNFGYWFFGTTSMTSIDVSNWDISSMTSLRRMFSTTGLTSIDISSWDTSNIENMEGLFNNSESLATITGIENLDLTSLTNAGGLLERCTSYVTGTFDFSWFTPPNVVITNSLFANTEATSIDMSGGFASANASFMFSNCTELVSVNATNLDLSNATNTTRMFADCSNLTTITGHEDWVISSSTNANYMFTECAALTTLNSAGWTFGSLVSAYAMFYNASSLANIDVSAWDMSTCTSVGFMFGGNRNMSFTNLDLSNWTISPVSFGADTLNAMSWMFSYCINLSAVDLSGFNTSGVLQLNGLFYNCRSIGAIDVTGLDTSNVVSMESAFYNLDGGTYGKNMVGIEAWDTSSVTNFEETFQNAKAWNPNIENWDTSSATNMRRMLYDCDSFNRNISAWDINQVTNLSDFLQVATGMSTANYDALLIGWAARIPLAYSGTLNFGGSQYTLGGAAEAARTQLIADVGAISDGGGV